MVFGNTIVVFSDKDVAFKAHGHLETNWARWARKAILTSANQAHGAERWLRQHPDRVFLDKTCERQLAADPTRPAVIGLTVLAVCPIIEDICLISTPLKPEALERGRARTDLVFRE